MGLKMAIKVEFGEKASEAVFACESSLALMDF
jgi:hypothetical protein